MKESSNMKCSNFIILKSALKLLEMYLATTCWKLVSLAAAQRTRPGKLDGRSSELENCQT